MLADRFDPRYFEPDVLFRYHAGWAGLSHSRNSPAWYFDRDGILREAGPDVPRIEWLDLDGDGRRETPTLKLERASTNHIRNPRCEGAIVGVVGSGGALPTHWPLDTAAGLTLSVEATGIDAGLPYIDLRIQGTPTGATVLQYFEGVTQIAAAPDEVWTGSVYARLVGGSLSGVTNVSLRIAEYQSGGGFLRASQQAIDLARSRHSITATMGADTGRVRHGLSVSVTQGVPVDLTLRIGGPQLEQSPVTSSLILPPVGAPAVSSRALDVLTAPWAHGLISCTGYVRFVETGGAQLMNATVASWFGAGSGLIWLRSSVSTPTYFLTVRDSRGMAAQVQTTPGVTTQVGQLVELMPQVEVSSEGVRARLIQAVDGGDPVTSSWTGYVQADWVPTTVRLVSTAGGSNQGQLNLRDLVVLRGSDWTMDAARRYLPW